jgi:uncharacterized membrane protein (UPF0136 family)
MNVYSLEWRAGGQMIQFKKKSIIGAMALTSLGAMLMIGHYLQSQQREVSVEFYKKYFKEEVLQMPVAAILYQHTKELLPNNKAGELIAMYVAEGPTSSWLIISLALRG